MRLIRCDLIAFKALVSMECYYAISLSESDLCCIELIACTFNTAVDTCRVEKLLGLIFVCRICNDILKSLLLLLAELALCLFRIGNLSQW